MLQDMDYSNMKISPKYSCSDTLNSKIVLMQSDITSLPVQAIVNAANFSLLGGGGVDGAIHAAAGPQLLEHCKKLQGCNTGEAKITYGYKLSAKYVIHTVGPRDQNSQQLQQCYYNCLELARKNKIRSIAFPCISTGIYGFPNVAAASIALETVRTWLNEHHDCIDTVVFCVYSVGDMATYLSLLPCFFPADKLLNRIGPGVTADSQPNKKKAAQP